MQDRQEAQEQLLPAAPPREPRTTNTRVGAALGILIGLIVAILIPGDPGIIGLIGCVLLGSGIGSTIGAFLEVRADRAARRREAALGNPLEEIEVEGNDSDNAPQNAQRLDVAPEKTNSNNNITAALGKNNGNSSSEVELAVLNNQSAAAASFFSQQQKLSTFIGVNSQPAAKKEANNASHDKQVVNRK